MRHEKPRAQPPEAVKKTANEQGLAGNSLKIGAARGIFSRRQALSQSGKNKLWKTGFNQRFLKCHRPSCRSGTSAEQAAWDEIGFLAFEHNVDRSKATSAWLDEAGVGSETKVVPPAPVKANHNKSDGVPARVEPDRENSRPPVISPPPAEATAKSPLQAFVERAFLSAADRQELKVKRGLSEAMIEGAGFLTNDRANLPILNALALEYPEWELAKCGLYKRTGTVYKPSGQFYGYGLVGKKKKLSVELLKSGDFDDLDDDDFVWAHKEDGLCNPILIPNYDLSGELIGLRPHKGFPKGQKPRLYLAGGRQAVQQCKKAVIVEGEFKTNALQDVVGKDWAVAAAPGITQVKNLHVWADILTWTKRIGAHVVVVVFDNEEHSDPKLRSFRPQIEDRFEAEIWARVSAVRLDREGYDAQVGHLPDEWGIPMERVTGIPPWQPCCRRASRGRKSTWRSRKFCRPPSKSTNWTGPNYWNRPPNG